MKKKRTLKIIAGIVGVLIIITPVLIFINSLTGNPLTKAIIKNKVSSYVKAVYDFDGEVEMKNYNPINGAYEGSCIINGQDYIFSASNKYVKDNKIDEHYRSEIALDIKDVSEYLSAQGKITWLDISTTILLGGKYSKNMQELNKSQKLYMNIRILSEEPKTLNKPEVISKIIGLLGEKYTITGFQIFFIDDINTYEYTIKESNKITIENIKKSEIITQRTDEEKEIEMQER